MEETLRYNGQTVRIDKGELVGYEVGRYEFIHQKGSPGWSSADTEMFPIIGPVNEAGYMVDTPKGKAPQDQHGHLRQFDYELISNDTTTAVYRKKYRANTQIANSKYPNKSDQQWLSWPYSFEFEKRFRLDEDELVITFSIKGDRNMPFMLGYHPTFKIYTIDPYVMANGRKITLKEIQAVGSRALQLADCTKVTLYDQRPITIETIGFGHFMCWTEVDNMVCLEPITHYPYIDAQNLLSKGFQELKDEAIFQVTIKPDSE